MGVPGIILLLKPTLYDGLRHILFILPGISLLAAVAIARIYSLGGFKLKIAGPLILLALSYPVLLDMSRLHPYEYIYFNRLSGGLPGAEGRYETDYWALSYREGMEWLNRHAPRNARIAVREPLTSASYFKRPDLLIVGENQTADYFMSTTRWNGHLKYPEAPVVYSVQRYGVPLAVVKSLGNPGKTETNQDL